MSLYEEPVTQDFWQLAREPGSGDFIDPLGPLNCTPHSMDRLIMRHYEGRKPVGISGIWPPRGFHTRSYTGDTSGGTNLGQMRQVGASRYGMTSILPRYRLPWPDFLEGLEETRGAILQVWYQRLRAHTVFRGSFTFNGNHAVYVNGYDRVRDVLTGIVDPLADGRQKGIFRGPGDYPSDLLRKAAGELNVASSGYRALGTGLTYAMFSQPTFGASVPPQPPTPINYGVTPMNILDGPTSARLLFGVGTPRRMALKKGQVLYRSPSLAGTNILDRLGADVSAVMTGIPANGWRTVVVSTRNFPDGIRRDVEAYVPRNAGVIS